MLPMALLSSSVTGLSPLPALPSISLHPETLTQAELAKHECKVCKRAYYDINAHHASEHPELLPTDAVHRFYCEECQKIFPNLTQHIRDCHRRPYHCPMAGCTERFAKMTDMRSHLEGPHHLNGTELDLVMILVRKVHSTRGGYTVGKHVKSRALQRQKVEADVAIDRDLAELFGRVIPTL
ncbi:hypothetical protein J8273_3450 [Carpediemonas membranifera]|uniref:C2H2-type domain-containing protein n=1 Tax=Carpediemonas membranifera TaxID=201153 RepID=A0A8J6ASG4_9EUKA|nr:hypothetical protein J8273_3450 [Carpediemonas membranifera]|eukprot:KAG9393316.1 hypothetical protein J8273_3450 [Carpediemonas membranifera]